jgi:hypothetical protein
VELCRTDSHPPWGQLPMYNAQAAAGEGVTISWKLDCFPQVMMVTNSPELCRTRLRQWPSRPQLCLGLFNHAYLFPPALILCLFKAKTQVCIWRWTEDLFYPFPANVRAVNKSPFSALHRVFIDYGGKWPELTCGSPGPWPGPLLNTSSGAERSLFLWSFNHVKKEAFTSFMFYEMFF